MKQWMGIVLACALAVSVVADDGLSKGKGKGGGASPKPAPAKPNPPKPTDPPKASPPKAGPQKGQGDRVQPATPPSNSDRNRERPTIQPGPNDGLAKGRPIQRRQLQTRTGRSAYGGSHNAMRAQAQSAPVDLSTTRMPSNRVVNPGQGSIAYQALREEDVRRGGYDQHNRFRSGYWFYDSHWSDDWFHYPWYRFSFNHRDCVFSPWYYYSHLPGYIVITRVNFDFNWIDFTFDRYYDWRPRDRWRDRDDDRWSDRWDDRDRDWRRSLDEAIHDIVDVFAQGDRRALDRLLPSRRGIRLDVDGFRYGISSDDFYDLMLDAAYNTRSADYRIREVRTGRGAARVIAEHVYQDTWGWRRSVFHAYTLVEDRRGWVIDSFAVRARGGGFW